ncbi:MAG: hypothetical protein HS113_04945 [Verrucomicrobiales bacterium]|nr:hypothetical protein [Verrucomicrobiales bacterium]
MPDASAGKGRGCFFYGCLTLLVLFLVCAVALYFGLRYAVSRMIAQYTAATPVAVPRVEGTPEEVQAVQARFLRFSDAIRAGQPTDPLVLSEKDLNLLIQHTRELEQHKDHLHVAIEGRRLRGTVSLPLEQLGWSRLKGRYFNGVAELKASLENGVLLVTLDALEVNGKPVPEQMMLGIRGQNLARDVYKDARSMELLKRLERIEVDDGRVLVRAREPAAEGVP